MRNSVLLSHDAERWEMIEIEEGSELQPVCPHCESEIGRILSREVRSTLDVRYVYFSESCRKVLGISQRKGFWMG